MRKPNAASLLFKDKVTCVINQIHIYLHDFFFFFATAAAIVCAVFFLLVLRTRQRCIWDFAACPSDAKWTFKAVFTVTQASVMTGTFIAEPR